MVAGVATVDSITNPDRMFTDAGIKVVLGKVVQADPVSKTLTLADGATLPFDKLILGMGARQLIPPMEGRDLNGVFTLRSAADAVNIHNFFAAANPRHLVFIGAGYDLQDRPPLGCKTVASVSQGSYSSFQSIPLRGLDENYFHLQC